MPTENRSTSNPGARTFTLDSLAAALEQVQALHEISADLIAEQIFGQPAGQDQGDPVAVVNEGDDGLFVDFIYGDNGNPLKRGDKLYTHATGSGLSEPLISVPDGYCLMPRSLTAENGAKALLLGEFKLEVTHECPECLELEEPAEGCEICDGEGEYAQRHTISWDQIKFIYSEAVRGLALQSHTALDRKSRKEHICTPRGLT